MADHENILNELTKRQEPWYSLTGEDVSQKLKTNTNTGLSEEEVKRRLAFFGPNEIEVETGLTRWQILLHQFKDPLIYILLAAAFVTFVLQDYIDSGVITTVVLLNALIGYIQESKAQKEMEALSKMSDPKVNVIRNRREMEIAARELVPGDIVLLSSGGRV
ncbi:cation-transporting P-type ATPase, partial [Fodinibius sp.]|uniref:cation-transporting P-type ATPase n=1 Tax=Fodinibius sp. TaxID=1872440 RepID=UPI0035660D37